MHASLWNFRRARNTTLQMWQFFIGWLKSVVVLGVWLSTPCVTWSSAYRNHIIRTQKHTPGIQNVPANQQQQLEECKVVNLGQFRIGIIGGHNNVAAKPIERLRGRLGAQRQHRRVWKTVGDLSGRQAFAAGGKGRHRPDLPTSRVIRRQHRVGERRLSGAIDRP